MRNLTTSIIVSLLSCFAMSGMALADNVTVTTDVDKYITVTFNYASVPFGALTAGTSDNIAPNQATGIYNTSVDTNFGYNVSSSGTTFSDGGSYSFAVSNLKMDTNAVAGSLSLGSSVALSGSPQVIDQYAYTATTNYHGFWLTIPASQYGTSYSSTVTISYVSQ